MRKKETIGTILEIPRELSLKLSRRIIDKAEIGEHVTKPELIIEFIKQGIEKALNEIPSEKHNLINKP